MQLSTNTTPKQEAIALIESIPDERTEVLLKIVKGIRELINADSQDDIYNDAEQDLALIEDAESLTHEGDDANG